VATSDDEKSSDEKTKQAAPTSKVDAKVLPKVRKPRQDSPARVAVRLGCALLAFGVSATLCACPAPDTAVEKAPEKAAEPAKADSPEDAKEVEKPVTKAAVPADAKAKAPEPKSPETKAK
jgi:hypothetical protein